MQRVLVANRGEIALRIVRGCHALGLEAVIAVSDADQGSLAAREADRVVRIGPAQASRSYLRPESIIMAARGVDADAIHPGYGFLSESAGFARLCEESGITFVGPSSAVIGMMGDKIQARLTAEAAGLELVPGTSGVRDAADAIARAADIGYPLLVKASAGGGGRGIRIVISEDELSGALASASAEAEAAFGNGSLYLERYVRSGRHVEVQVLGDNYGNVVHLGTRDCSLQRRYQKMVEEGPALCLPDAQIERMQEQAVALCSEISYSNAGTVEFIADVDTQEFFFLEMNTRIQVEHPVTESITGEDLIRQQLLIAAGDRLSFEQKDVRFSGHAIECRITAEDATAGFRPSPGRIRTWRPPVDDAVRLDSHCFEGYEVPPFYDSLLAKLIVHGTDRGDALQRAVAALDDFAVEGIATNIGFVARMLRHSDVEQNRIDTKWVERNMPALETY